MCNIIDRSGAVIEKFRGRGTEYYVHQRASIHVPCSICMYICVLIALHRGQHIS